MLEETLIYYINVCSFFYIKVVFKANYDCVMQLVKQAKFVVDKRKVKFYNNYEYHYTTNDPKSFLKRKIRLRKSKSKC